MDKIYNFDSAFEDVVEDTSAVFQETLDDSSVVESKMQEVLTAVVLTKCPVISYNRNSGVLVYERDGKLIQTNTIQYSGEGYVEVE